MEDIDITMARNSRVLRTVLLLITVVFLSLPAKAQYGGGSGEPNDPYLIYTAGQMNEIGANRYDWGKHFRLMADIDLSEYTGTEYNVIGTDMDNRFTGVFDGNGHTISNFSYTSTDRSYIGIFGCVGLQLEKGEIRDLGVVEPNVDAGTGSGVGSLVGYLGDGTISNCYADGVIISGSNKVGGLVGGNGSTITNCYATGTVSGTSESWYGGTGGLAGFNSNRIVNCYSMADVWGNQTAGGLVGMNSGHVITCYSTGSVSGNRNIGGLVGIRWGGTTTNCFWDTQITGKASGDDGTIKTTAEMQTASTFSEAGWDFVDETANGTEDIWWIDEGQDYPRLWWEPSLERTTDLVVDDFESYNDLDHDDPNSNRIYLVWIDGWYDPSNGAITGFVEPPWVGRTIAHSGVQSMSFAYDNSVGYSEATANVANLTIGRDWTTEGVSVLSLWFGDVWGSAGNAPEPMYVALANADGTTAVVYNDNPNATQVDTWTEWRINLQRFDNQGVDLTNINTISIGFGDKNNPQAGGSGVMYFDDIKVTSTSSSLVSHWKFDEGTGSTAFDSWGSNDGTITGASWVNGLIEGALDFDGSGDYVNVGNDDSLEIDITNSNVTISAWVYPKVLDNYEPVFVVDDYDGAYYGYMLMITPNGHVWLTYGDGTGIDLNNRKTKTGTTSLQTNIWYHVVGVIRGATDMSIFINGLDDGGEYSGNGGEVSYSSASASIGRVRFGTLDNEFNGSLDEVMVFNRALTEGEVRLLPVLLKRGIPLP